jgi:hypothetical protein
MRVLQLPQPESVAHSTCWILIIDIQRLPVRYASAPHWTFVTSRGLNQSEREQLERLGRCAGPKSTAGRQCILQAVHLSLECKCFPLEPCSFQPSSFIQLSKRKVYLAVIEIVVWIVL